MAEGGWYPCCGKCRTPLIKAKLTPNDPVVCPRCSDIWDGSSLTQEEVESSVTRVAPQGPERTVMWELKVAMRHLLSMWEHRAQAMSAQGKETNLYKLCEELAEVLSTFAWPDFDPKSILEDQYARSLVRAVGMAQHTGQYALYPDLGAYLNELLVSDLYVRQLTHRLLGVPYAPSYAEPVEDLAPEGVWFVAMLNDMRASQIEIVNPRFRTRDNQEIADYLMSERVEFYADGQWGKYFRKGGPLEWYNDPGQGIGNILAVYSVGVPVQGVSLCSSQFLKNVPTIEELKKSEQAQKTEEPSVAEDLEQGEPG